MIAGNDPAGSPATGGGGAEAHETAEAFGDRLATAVARRESQLVLGLDPDPARLWPHAIAHAGGADGGSAPSQVAALAVARHCELVIEAVAGECVAVKPQVACFERLGAPGWEALAHTVQVSRNAGLLVIADAKRGDIDVSAAAYAQAFFGEISTPFGPVPGLGADALTVNPLMGADTLTPFVDGARVVGGGLFVLARTSNPGAADVQDLELSDGGTVSERLAVMIAHAGAGGIGRSGLADVGAVVGATAPGRLARLRALMPHAVFLLPGVGAQGGRVEDLAEAFAPGPAGGLISASRALVYAHEKQGGDPADAARREAARLRELAWSLTA